MSWNQNNSTTNKKLKPTTMKPTTSTTSDQDPDYEKIKQYVLECPYASKDHRLIKVALEAIEKEQNRIERDRKLQLKFSKQQQQTMNHTVPSGPLAVDPIEDGMVVVEKNHKDNNPRSATDMVNDEEEMEWQDVVPHPEEGKESITESSATGTSQDAGATTTITTTTSFLGQTLAKAVIEKISEYQQTVKSPWGAIMIALHASLRSDLLGFACTGIPEPEMNHKTTTNKNKKKTTTTSSIGFAPPVRELTEDQFLPVSWDSSSRNMALRYRKAGIGAIVLRLEVLEEEEDTNNEMMVTVRFQLTSTKEPSPLKIEFPLSEYMNLDSWNQATKTSPYISPTLHYKSLAVLLTRFCQTFELGPMEENTQSTLNMTASMANQYYHHHPSEFISSHQEQRGGLPSGITTTATAQGRTSFGGTGRRLGEIPTTMGEAFPGLIPPRVVSGDFAGDLAPGGIIHDPSSTLFGGGNTPSGGLLMGPNHPIFQGTYDPSSHLVPGRGGGGMNGGIGIGGRTLQPRYDPIFPNVVRIDDIPSPHPGGGMIPPTAGRRYPPPRGGVGNGELNPDHLPPPNTFHNMYM